MGVPSEDHDTFRQWADNIVSIEVTSDSDIDSIRKADKTIADMDIYFSKLIEKKKKIPTNDLISHIIRAKVDGHSLSEKEILSFCSLLLNAVHITTVNLIGNLVFSLLENPQEFKQLQENQNSLIKPTIEETSFVCQHVLYLLLQPFELLLFFYRCKLRIHTITNKILYSLLVIKILKVRTLSKTSVEL